MNLDGLCSCSRGFTCGYHFAEFLREQGFSKGEAQDITCFELSEDTAAWWLYGERRLGASRTTVGR